MHSGYFKIYTLRAPFDRLGCYEFQKPRMNYSVNGHVPHAEFYGMFHPRLPNSGWEMHMLVIQILWTFSEESISTSCLKEGCDVGSQAYFTINPRD